MNAVSAVQKAAAEHRRATAARLLDESAQHAVTAAAAVSLAARCVRSGAPDMALLWLARWEVARALGDAKAARAATQITEES